MKKQITPQMGMKVTGFIALTILAALVIKLIEVTLGWPIAFVFTLSAVLYFVFDEIVSRKPKENNEALPTPIEEAKKLLFNRLKTTRGIHGAGIATHNGKEVIKVYYEGGAGRHIPSSFLGYEVLKEKTGCIHLI